ncbi:hypothetical protein AVEN_185191-1, partial [Araneus ventricosus]
HCKSLRGHFRCGDEKDKLASSRLPGGYSNDVTVLVTSLMIGSTSYGKGWCMSSRFPGGYSNNVTVLITSLMVGSTSYGKGWCMGSRLSG